MLGTIIFLSRRHACCVLRYGAHRPTLRDPPSFGLIHTCCLGSWPIIEARCCHINDVMVEAITFASHCCATFAHHYTFDFSLQQLNVFIHVVRHCRVVSKVIELAHGVDSCHTNFLRRLAGCTVSSPSCVKLRAQLAGETNRLGARWECLIVEKR